MFSDSGGGDAKLFRNRGNRHVVDGSPPERLPSLGFEFAFHLLQRPPGESRELGPFRRFVCIQVHRYLCDSMQCSAAAVGLRRPL